MRLPTILVSLCLFAVFFTAYTSNKAQDSTPISPESTINASVSLFDVIWQVIGRLFLLNLPQSSVSESVPTAVFATPTFTPLPPTAAPIIPTEAPVIPTLEPTFTPNPQPTEDERVTFPNGDIKVQYSVIEAGNTFFTTWEVIYDGATNAVIYDSRDYISTLQLKSKLSADGTRFATDVGLFSYPDLGRLVDFTAPEVGVAERVISLIYSNDGTGLAVVSIHYNDVDSVFRLHTFDLATGAVRHTMEAPYGRGSIPIVILDALENLGFPRY